MPSDLWYLIVGMLVCKLTPYAILIAFLASLIKLWRDKYNYNKANYYVPTNRRNDNTWTIR